VPVGAVLEGGYDLDALAASVAATLEALADGGEPVDAPADEITRRAIAVVGRRWPVAAA
jgi:acetoin utilization deacetylase AcuC-like enzyme